MNLFFGSLEIFQFCFHSFIKDNSIRNQRRQKLKKNSLKRRLNNISSNSFSG